MKRLQKWAKLWGKLTPWIHAIWEPMPKLVQKLLLGGMQLGFAFVLLLLAVIALHKLWPNLPLNLAFKDFKISTTAAKLSAEEAERSERRAKAASDRIEAVERTIQGQRATLDAAFSLAANANKLSGMATQTLVEAKQSLIEMKKDAEFIDLMTRAIAGFADAYDKLCQLPPSDPNFEKAFNVGRYIKSHYALFVTTFYKNAALPAPLNRTNATLAEIQEAYPKMFVDRQLETVEFVVKEPRFRLKEKFSFLYPLAILDPNLQVRAFASQRYEDLAGISNVNDPLAYYVIKEHWMKTASVLK